MLGLLESRLDNVVQRLGFAFTRAQARQLVRHGHVLVNGSATTFEHDLAPRRQGEIRQKSREIKEVVASLAQVDKRRSSRGSSSTKELHGIFKGARLETR